jgi:hypothetical protein
MTHDHDTADISVDDREEYSDGYDDGYNGRERQTNALESWYVAGYENGQSDRLMKRGN